ncbi:hypothetical protein D7Y13_12365 [Corallococcus praedator]|uniref:Uncharacterized protein n=1 Tax=Corallococcus praedator TaxID=2316724 RepID=A0ABX9QJS3_9BACT|nr:hypothetical protein D7X75_02230 [Corallococcus sp. CA031C]RKI10606.1 hypothetical protein D7Y13_12365 [Corallococcus praedator]
MAFRFPAHQPDTQHFQRRALRAFRRCETADWVMPSDGHDLARCVLAFRLQLDVTGLLPPGDSVGFAQPSGASWIR